VFISSCTRRVKQLNYNNEKFVRFTRKCGDTIKVRWMSLQFSDVKFPQDIGHENY